MPPSLERSRGPYRNTIERGPEKARVPSRSFHSPFSLANPSDSNPDRLDTPTDDATSANSMATTPETVRNVPPDRLLRYETRTSKSPLLRKKLSTNIFGKSFRMLPHPLVYQKSTLQVPPHISSRGPTVLHPSIGQICQLLSNWPVTNVTND